MPFGHNHTNALKIGMPQTENTFWTKAEYYSNGGTARR